MKKKTILSFALALALTVTAIGTATSAFAATSAPMEPVTKIATENEDAIWEQIEAVEKKSDAIFQRNAALWEKLDEICNVLPDDYDFTNFDEAAFIRSTNALTEAEKETLLADIKELNELDAQMEALYEKLPDCDNMPLYEKALEKAEPKVLDEFDTLSRTTPQIAKMNPACKYNVIDFYYDGGVPRLMENLQTMLETDAMTVTAHTLAENIASHKYRYPATGLVNHTMDNPFGYTGGVAVLRGNLAPDTGITKPGAFDKSLHHFEGEAICFDSEEAAEEAILAGKVRDGHVVVIRYEGPKGGPGMREMYKAMKYLYGRGLSKTTALITDGRFSGTNNGCFVGHISPEAAEGGPIAIIHDGDRIVIDIESRRLDLMVSQEEIDARLKTWKRPEPKFKKGWLGLYCKIAASGSEGAVLKFENL